MKLKSFFAIAVLLIIGAIIYLKHISSDIKVAKESDSIRETSNAPKEYWKLFSDTSKLRLERTLFSKTRNPISIFDYNDKFILCLYKITETSHSLKTLITETYTNQPNQSSNQVYNSVLDDDSYEMLFKSGQPGDVEQILLNQYGTGTICESKNDSIAYYYCHYKNFSLTYSLKSPLDLHSGLRSASNANSCDGELMFIRYNNGLYLVYLGSRKGMGLTPGTLSKLIR